MGWMWASPAASTASRDGEKAAHSPPPSSPPQSSTKKPESDYGDPEIAKFMAQIQNEFGGGTSARPSSGRAEPSASSRDDGASKSSSLWGTLWGSSSATASSPPSASAAPSALSPSLSVPRETAGTDTALEAPAAAATTALFWDAPAERPPALDPISESLLPTTMSCRQAFDAAFYCQSVGSQFHSIYRAGTVRTCSEHWDDFWFCMRTRAYSGPVKEAAIRDHYRRREWARYGPGRPSSTDVWTSRDEKVKPGEAFRERYDQPTISDEEWRVAEVERRLQVQEALAKEQRP